MVAGFTFFAVERPGPTPTPDVGAVTAASPTVLVDRDGGTASRSQDRAPLPLTVRQDAVWEFDDGGLTEDLERWAAEIEAREAAEAAAAAEAARVAAAQEAARQAAAPPAGSTPDVGSVKAFASDLVGGGEQWACLEALWQKESGWNHRADNPSSSAYGIPQALPGSKMASAGADWATNPLTQVKWGVRYIESRYGTPCGAWAQSQAYNWY